MAVDSTLISGAYKANKPQGVVGVKEITEIGEAISGGLNDYMDSMKAKHTKLNAEYEAFSKEVLNNSDLIGEQYEELYNQLNLDKEDFAKSDKKTRDLKLRDLAAMAGDYSDYKALREEVAINLSDYSPVWQDSDEGQAYLKILKGEGHNLKKENGRIGIEVNGEWKSIANIKQEIDANKIDRTAIDELEAYRLKAQADTSDFNYDQTRASIMNSLVSKSSYNSLINDEIAGNKVFKVQLMEALTQQSYSNLGITEEILQNTVGGEEMQSINADGIIDAEEAENIFKHLKEDKSTMKEVLADYYTSHIQESSGGNSNSSSGNSSGVDKTAINASYGYTNEQALSNQQTLKDEGFDIEEDGIWGPKSQEVWDKYTKSPAENFDFNEDDEFVPQVETPQVETPTYSPSLSRSQVSAVESLSIQSTPNGGANILENGNAITMDIEGGIATVDAVRADGNSIVVDTSGFMAPGKNAPFGKFTKQGDGYKWEPDMAMQKKFAKYASEDQKRAMMTFINLMETDPQYAKALINHIGKNEGTINAATLR